ncbi:MAG: DNA/RNA non-specific endonuclease [Lentisphaeria bacterium]|nr:DNA/RNA non-specific endonuclease [Lentisphaeria bacterium]
MKLSIFRGRKRKVVLIILALGAAACSSAWLFVHMDMRRQNEWVSKSRGLLWPVVCLGETVTGVTDSVGIGGKEAWADLGGNSFRGDDLYAGPPRTKGWLFDNKAHVFKNTGYVVGYDESSRNPSWVGYRVFTVDDLVSGERPSRFKVDERTYAQVRHDDYKGSGYDRGHMAPNYAIATRYGRQAQIETFLMSNIAPQKPALNRGPWKDVEMAVARFYGQSCGEVWVVTGPIYGKDVDRLESGVAIPEAYYKIIVDEKDGKLRALAFIFSQESKRRQWPRRCLVSIDTVEDFSGLDFFRKLPDHIENELEAKTSTRMWSVPILLQLKHAFRR